MRTDGRWNWTAQEAMAAGVETPFCLWYTFRDGGHEWCMFFEGWEELLRFVAAVTGAGGNVVHVETPETRSKKRS